MRFANKVFMTTVLACVFFEKCLSISIGSEESISKPEWRGLKSSKGLKAGKKSKKAKSKKTKSLPSTPSMSPSSTPSMSPSSTPSMSPSILPTDGCPLDASLTCTAVMNSEEIQCGDITNEKQPVCSCPRGDCVQALSFIYTGKSCNGNSGSCTDIGPNPATAVYKITNDLDSTEVIATGTVQQGKELVFEAVTNCIPDTLAVEISIFNGVVSQTFTIDASCDGGLQLTLLEDYGAFASYGYSCSETDTHNCRQAVSYGPKVCNETSEDQTVSEFILTHTNNQSGEEISYGLVGVHVLSPGNCLSGETTIDVNRCEESDYYVEVLANDFCPAVDSVEFGWGGIPQFLG